MAVRGRRFPPAQAAGRRAVRGRHRIVPAAPGGRENAGETIRNYTEAVRWFATACLLLETGKTRWEQVDRQDIERWMVYLLAQYSDAYASIQYRALQQFFRWLAEEEEFPDPMARPRPPKVSEKPVPVFTSVELSALEKGCQGKTFARRRDAAIIAVFPATGIPAGELAGIRYDACDPARSDVDLWRREIKVCGKGGRARVVKIATRRPGPWTGTRGCGPGTRRRGARSCGSGLTTAGR